MTYLVDFNNSDRMGRVPTLLARGEAATLQPGAKVIATDGEGTECRAMVAEIGPGGRYAILDPIDGTWNLDSTLRPSSVLI